MLYLKSPLFFFFFLSEFRDNIHKQAKSEKKKYDENKENKFNEQLEL